VKKAIKKIPSVTRRRRRWQKFVPHLQPTNFGSRNLLGQLDILHTQNFEVKVPKGTPLVKVFWNFVKERFSWPENGFIVFSRYDLVKKSVVRFNLGWNFLNKTSNLTFILRIYGEIGQNHYFVQFCSTNFIIEQNWWHFCSAFLHFKDN
jgi:hypothetical protein